LRAWPNRYRAVGSVQQETCADLRETLGVAHPIA